jgi:hypothetical protein
MKTEPSHSPRRPTSHAFVVPVVRELPPQPPRAAGDSAW